MTQRFLRIRGGETMNLTSSTTEQKTKVSLNIVEEARKACKVFQQVYPKGATVEFSLYGARRTAKIDDYEFDVAGELCLRVRFTYSHLTVDPIEQNAVVVSLPEVPQN
jgi:hypothetical protein